MRKSKNNILHAARFELARVTPVDFETTALVRSAIHANCVDDGWMDVCIDIQSRPITKKFVSCSEIRTRAGFPSGF